MSLQTRINRLINLLPKVRPDVVPRLTRTLLKDVSHSIKPCPPIGDDELRKLQHNKNALVRGLAEIVANQRETHA